MSADHQNKPDIGASKFREWADQDGVNMILGGSNTGVNIAMSKVAAAEEDAVHLDRRRRRFADQPGLHALHRALRLRHDGAGQRHRQHAIVKQRRQELVLPDCRLRLRHPAAGRRDQGRRGQRRQGRWARCGSRCRQPTSRPSCCRRRARGRRFSGLANAGGDFINSLKAAQEFGITKTMKPAALLAFINDIHGLGLKTAQGLYLTDRLVLGPERRDARLRQALLREDEEGCRR